MSGRKRMESAPRELFIKGAIASTVLLLAAQPVWAAQSDRVGFREFREQHSGLDRSLARQMFRQQFGRHGNNSGNARTSLEHSSNTFSNVEIARGGVAGIDHPNRDSAGNRVHHGSMQQFDSATIKINQGVELDLSSAERNIILGKNLFSDQDSSVDISVGGKVVSVSAGSQVTAAEYVAVKQVVADGGQKVSLDRSGRAIGGDIDLGALTDAKSVMRAASLTVPEGVTTTGDFGRHSDFRVLGDLTNYGTVQAVSSDTAVHDGTIHANNIVNEKGASIESSVDLHLDAAVNLSNYGSVSSSSNLSLSAGGTLTNTGSVNATGNVDLRSANVVNRGVVASSNGNISINAQDTQIVNVDNVKGAFEALNGSINLRSADYTGSCDSNLYGGNLLSKELNLNSGAATASVNVFELTGTVNQSGSATHVLAATDLLNIGTTCLTGDPTFYNSQGSINIAGDITVAENLVFVATGDITSNDGITIQAGNTTQGFDITFISGAAFTPASGTGQGSVGPVSGLPPYPGSGSVTLSGKSSKTGGGILLGDGVTISSRSTDSIGDDKGGSVRMFAFGKETGIVDVGGTTVLGGGRNAGDNGSFSVNAAGSSALTGATIRVGNVDLSGGTGLASGSVFLITNAIGNSGPVTYDAAGTRSGGSLTSTFKYQKDAAIVFEDNGGSGAVVARSIDATASGTITIGSDLRATTNEILLDTTGSGDIVQDPSAAPLAPFTDLRLTTFGGQIGSAANPIRILDTTGFEFDPRGGIGFADVIGSGGTFDVVSFKSNELHINAPNSVVDIRRVDGVVLDLTAKSFQLAQFVVHATESLALKSPVSLAGLDFNLIETPVLHLSAPTIGTSQINPLQLAASIEQVSFDSNQTFASSAAVKNITVLSGDAGNLFFRANTSITMSGDIAASTGTLDVATTAKSLIVEAGAHVSALNGLTLANSGTTKKDKIVIGAGAVIDTTSATPGLADVAITLGTPVGPPDIATPANVTEVETGGTVAFRGQGLTAKAPVNTVKAKGADVTISNSIGVKNMTLGGSVQITADPPVPQGTPTVVTHGPSTTRFRQGTSTLMVPTVNGGLADTNALAAVESTSGFSYNSSNLGNLSTVVPVFTYSSMLSGIHRQTALGFNSNLSELNRIGDLVELDADGKLTVGSE